MKASLATLLKTGLTCPKGRSRIEYVDSGEGSVPGLFIEARSTSPGTGTWYLRFRPRDSRTTAYKRLGSTGDVGLADARKAARTLRAEVALGRNPRAEEKARRSALTLSEFFDLHYWPHIQPPRKLSAKRDLELFKRCAVRMGNVRLNELTRQQIQTFHTDLKSEGLAPATCDHHIKLIRQMLNLAVEWGLLEKNPASRLRLFNANNRVEHLLDDEQLARLLGVLRTDPNRMVCHVATLLLSTGARVSEALNARWLDIEREHRLWRIPAQNSKSGRTRAVPLSDAALEVLDQLDTEGRFEHLFVNKHRSKESEQRLRTIAKVWGRIRKKAGLPHLRIHDLRHTFASLLVNSGQTLFVVGQVLGHSSPSVTERYAHLSTKTLQDAANAASVAIQRKPEPEQPPAKDAGAEGGPVTQPAAA